MHAHTLFSLLALPMNSRACMALNPVLVFFLHSLDCVSPPPSIQRPEVILPLPAVISTNNDPAATIFHTLLVCTHSAARGNDDSSPRHSPRFSSRSCHFCAKRYITLVSRKWRGTKNYYFFANKGVFLLHGNSSLLLLLLPPPIMAKKTFVFPLSRT